MAALYGGCRKGLGWSLRSSTALADVLCGSLAIAGTIENASFEHDMAAAMLRTMAGLESKPTGDVNRDFVAMRHESEMLSASWVPQPSSKMMHLIRVER